MGLCQNTSTPAPAHQPALYKLQTIVKCSHRSLGGGSTADTIASHPPHSTFDGISQRRCIKTYLSTITWHWPKIGPMSLVTVTFPAAAAKLIYREITVGLVLLSLAPDSRAWLPPALFIIFNCFTCGSFSNLAILFHKRHVRLFTHWHWVVLTRTRGCLDTCGAECGTCGDGGQWTVDTSPGRGDSRQLVTSAQDVITYVGYGLFGT